MKGGIYQIRNLINNKIYIGSTKNFIQREKRHFIQLRGNYHHSIYLQRAFNKYGEENFIFEILEECDEDILLKREQYYLDLLQPFSPNGYNISTIATNCVLYGSDNGMYGKPSAMKNKHHSDSAKEKISQSNRGKKRTDECKKKESERVKKEYAIGIRKNPQKGKQLTEYQKEKLHEANSIPVKQLDKNTLEVICVYDSIINASRKTNIDSSSIVAVCKHKSHHNTAGGYKWEYSTPEEYQLFNQQILPS